MTKVFQILLVEIYALLTSYCFVTLLILWGLPVSLPLTVGIWLGWTAFCFSSAYLGKRIAFGRSDLRKPVKAEEDKLNTCFQEVLQRAGISKRFRLLIREEMDCNATAIGHCTIVLSRRLISEMTAEELKAMLAHELGHLCGKDGVVREAFSAAISLPKMVITVYEIGRRLLFAGYGNSEIRYLRKWGLVLRVLLLLGLLYLLFALHILWPLFMTVLFVWIVPKVSNFFVFLWRITNRFTEYERDAFAFKLGYGPAMRQALFKITQKEPQVVSPYEILIRGSHPVVYNRIRRLEKLEGIRQRGS